MFRLKTQLTNISLRILPLGLKFIASLMIVRYYTLDKIGLYNNILGYISLFVYFIGLQLSYVTNREIVKSGLKKKKQIIINQIYAHCAVYFLIFIPVYVFFEHKYNIGLLFFSLLLLSHINQEIYRFLYSLKKPLAGSIVFSFGNGLWALPILLLFLFGIYPSIDFLLLIIILFALISICVGIAVLLKELGRNEWNMSVDIPFILSIVKTGLPVMLSVLAFRSSELVGRFALEHGNNLSVSGVFSSFQIICSLILILSESGITVITFPHLVENLNKSVSEYTRIRSNAFLQTVCLSIAGPLMLVVLSVPCFEFLHKREFLLHVNSFYIMTLAYAALTLSSFYNTILYVHNQDRVLVIINIVTALISYIFIFVFIFILGMGLLGASITLLGWSILQLTLKYAATKRYATIP